jgi:hypothetical protein
MNMFTEGENGVRSLSYFALCRDIGVKAVDGMVRGRILDLRWTDIVRKTGGEVGIQGLASKSSVFRPRGGAASVQTEDGDDDDHFRAASSGTMVNDAIVDAEEGEIVPAASPLEVSPIEGFPTIDQDNVEDDEGPDDDFVGPKLVPATPIMRFAMREVVADYYVEEDTVSEYASLSDPDEY